MNTFAMILTIMVAPVNVAANEALTLQPSTTIQFVNTTAKKASADCERVRVALQKSNMIAFCSVQAQTITPAVAPAN